MANLMIVRGLPGSGKSTFVRNNYPGLFHLETDMFNIENGEYVYTDDRLYNAIETIQRIIDLMFMRQYKSDFCLVGVYARTKTFQFTVKDALLHGYNVYIKTLTTQYGNIHDVPTETLQIMKDNFVSEEALKSYFENDLILKCDRLHFGEMPKFKF